MARIREFERIQNESNYGGGYSEYYRGYGGYNEYKSYNTNYTIDNLDNTQSYRSGRNYGNPIRNDLYYPDRPRERENDYNYNNYNSYNQNQKRNWMIEDDEEEDELYFYGGGGRKKKQQQPQVEDKDEIFIPTEAETIAKTATDDFEYDPADFESSDLTSSSWSSEESDYEKMLNKKKKESGAVKSKLKFSVADEKEILTTVKPKAYAPKVIDLDAPTIIKLPPNPIPNTWAHIVHNPLKAIQKQLPSTIEILTKSIWHRSWLKGLKLKNPVQGILMRPPFDQQFTIKEWAKFMQKLLPTVMKDGYLFIWIEREELADVIRAAEQYLSFKYVENLCWIRRDVGNRLMREPPNVNPALFYKSKMTLLILRRDPNNQCKLRHQRNPDCIFDFVGPGRMPDGRVYDVIETLLDGTKMAGPHLMHLWAGNSPTDRLVYQARKQWIRVLEVDDEEEESASEMGTVEASVEDEAEIVEMSTVIDTAETDDVVADDAMAINTDGHPETDVTPVTLTESSVSNTEDVTMAHDKTAEDLETELPVNKDEEECKLPGLLGSSTFDEDFCNFIVCEPLSNC